MSKKKVTSGGIGVSGVLWIVLIILKILGQISMNWFLVLTGIIWIPVSIFIGILTIFGIVISIMFLIALIFNR